LRLLGGLTAVAAVALPLAAQPEATPQEPIPYPIWTVEDVAVAGYNHALALDSLDRPHLLFQDPATGMVRYAVREADGWHFDDIAIVTVNWVYLSFDLEIGPDGAPCLAYAMAPSGLPADSELVYGCRGPDGWDVVPIDDGGLGVSLVFPTDGQPRIVTRRDASAVYLSHEDGHWHSDIVATDSSHLGGLWLLLDSAGRPHVLYYGRDGAFDAVQDENAVWVKTPLSQSNFATPRFDAADRLWLTVVHATDLGGHPPIYDGKFYLGRPDASGHALELVDEGDSLYGYADLALGGESAETTTPQLIFRGEAGELSYAWWTDDGMQRHTLSPAGFGAVNMELGSDGQPRVTYNEGQNDMLRLATRQIILLDESVALPFVVGSP
jgi:hypothetical protein